MTDVKAYEAPVVEQLGGTEVTAGVALPLPVVVVVVGPAVVVV